MFDSGFAAIGSVFDQAGAFLRENRVIMFALIGLGAIILLQFIVLPLFNYNKSVQRQVKVVGGQLEQVSLLSDEYEKLRNLASGSGPAKKGANLFARLENLTRKLKVAASVDFMRPSTKTLDDGRIEEEVYVRFKSMLQKDFVRFLYSSEIEGGVVSIKHMRIKKDKSARFDVDIIFTRVDG